MTRNAMTWIDYGEALAFAGNSLLAPMNRTQPVGLVPEFWRMFPDFDDEGVKAALKVCEKYADEAQRFADEGGDPVQRASVEYTALFIGPPKPKAAPWETMYGGGGREVTVGFGQATFEMQGLLREAGLEVSNENNQYADHIGIELLYASVLCSRIAEADDDAAAQAELEEKLGVFVREHPLAWIGELQAAVAEAEPSGYIASLLGLASALLVSIE